MQRGWGWVCPCCPRALGMQHPAPSHLYRCLAGINWAKPCAEHLCWAQGHPVSPCCMSQGLTSGSSTTTCFTLLSMASSSSSSQPRLPCSTQSKRVLYQDAGVGNGVSPVKGLVASGCDAALVINPLHFCLLTAFPGLRSPGNPLAKRLRGHLSPSTGTSPLARSAVLGPKQTLKLLSRLEHPAMATAKARPGPVPVSLRRLGHLDLLKVGQEQTGHQSFPTNRKTGVAAG